MTESQINILLHALGWTTGGQGTRNHYEAVDGSPEYLDCIQLVRSGLMERREDINTPVFTVTSLGCSILHTHGHCGQFAGLHEVITSK